MWWRITDRGRSVSEHALSPAVVAQPQPADAPARRSAAVRASTAGWVQLHQSRHGRRVSSERLSAGGHVAGRQPHLDAAASRSTPFTAPSSAWHQRQQHTTIAAGCVCGQHAHAQSPAVTQPPVAPVVWVFPRSHSSTTTLLGVRAVCRGPRGIRRVQRSTGADGARSGQQSGYRSGSDAVRLANAQSVVGTWARSSQHSADQTAAGSAALLSSTGCRPYVELTVALRRVGRCLDAQLDVVDRRRSDWSRGDLLPHPAGPARPVLAHDRRLGAGRRTSERADRVPTRDRPYDDGWIRPIAAGLATATAGRLRRVRRRRRHRLSFCDIRRRQCRRRRSRCDLRQS